LKCRVQFEDSRLLLARRRSLLDSPLEEAGCGLFVPLGISASPSWCSRARKPHGAPEGEFLRGGTNSSNPSPSSGESTNLGPGGAPVPVRHLDPWGFPLVPATLIGRLAIDRPYYGQRWSNLLFLDTRNRCSRSEAASFAVIVDALADEARNFYIHTAFCS